jgi:hypothetical protein
VRVTGVDDDRTFLVGLARWGRDGDLVATGAGELVLKRCPAQTTVDDQGTCTGRLETRRDGITEWWHNRPNGLEQGFTIDRRPEGSGPVVVEIAVRGASVEIDEDGKAADFADDAGWTLRYNKLRAWDARGTTLPARMVSTQEGLDLRVDDIGAHYPITIDPLLASPGWTGEGDPIGTLFGYSVSSAGDVNADGFGDVIVGAYQYDNEGRAFVYYAEVVNRAPLAVDDSATTDENTPVTVDVLANDTDPDGDVLTVTVPSYRGACWQF